MVAAAVFAGGHAAFADEQLGEVALVEHRLEEFKARTRLGDEALRPFDN